MVVKMKKDGLFKFDNKDDMKRYKLLVKTNKNGKYHIHCFNRPDRLTAICVYVLIWLPILAIFNSDVYYDLPLPIVLVMFFIFYIPSAYDLGVFNYHRIIKNNELGVLPYLYTSDIGLLDTLEERAHQLGYVYKRVLNTHEVEDEHLLKMWYERFHLYTKVDTTNSLEFPQEKIAVYRSNRYIAEYNNRHRRCIRNETLYKEYIDMFCKKTEYTYLRANAINPIDTILLVIVDDLDYFLSQLLYSQHQNYLLFCVIAKNNPGKLFIGNDLRRNQDKDYVNRIKDLIYLLDIKDVDDQYIADQFAANEVYFRGKKYF